MDQVAAKLTRVINSDEAMVLKITTHAREIL